MYALNKKVDNIVKHNALRYSIYWHDYNCTNQYNCSARALLLVYQMRNLRKASIAYNNIINDAHILMTIKIIIC